MVKKRGVVMMYWFINFLSRMRKSCNFFLGMEEMLLVWKEGDRSKDLKNDNN